MMKRGHGQTKVARHYCMGSIQPCFLCPPINVVYIYNVSITCMDGCYNCCVGFGDVTRKFWGKHLLIWCCSYINMCFSSSPL